LSFSTVN